MHNASFVESLLAALSKVICRSTDLSMQSWKRRARRSHRWLLLFSRAVPVAYWKGVLRPVLRPCAVCVYLLCRGWLAACTVPLHSVLRWATWLTLCREIRRMLVVAVKIVLSDGWLSNRSCPNLYCTLLRMFCHRCIDHYLEASLFFVSDLRSIVNTFYD